MNFWKVILSTLAIFTAGIFTGATVNSIGHRSIDRSHRFPFRNAPAKPVPAGTNSEPSRLTLPYVSRPPGKNQGRDFMERLDRELKLTPQQHLALMTILEESQKRSKAIWDKISPELREEMKTSREKMREVFTPEQLERFDELMKPKPGKPPGFSTQQQRAPEPDPANP